MSDEQEKTGPGTIEAVPTEMYERQNNVFSEPMEMLHKLAPRKNWNLCRIMRDQFQAWFALYCGDDIAVAWAPPIRCAERIYSYARGFKMGEGARIRIEWADDIIELLANSFRQMAYLRCKSGWYDSNGLSVIEDVGDTLVKFGILASGPEEVGGRKFYQFIEKDRAE